MEKYCTKCGKALVDGQPCECQTRVGAFKTEFKSAAGTTAEKISTAFKKGAEKGFYIPDADNVFERNKKIVPDVIQPEEDEIPVKQYDVAKLRSRIKGERAEGRLELTTKRLIFRAAGVAYNDKLVSHHEFAIDDIAGIEVKNHRRVSPLNIIFCVILTALFFGITYDLFFKIGGFLGGFGNVINVAVSLVLAAPFFLWKKSFWVKFIASSFGYAAAYAFFQHTSAADAFLFGFRPLNTIFMLYFVLYAVFWIINVVLVCTVPDLQVIIKTKGAGIAMEIRRKERGIFNKQPNTYTGFSEVLPWTDALLVAEEAGAIIKDIQLYGNECVDKWKTL